MKRSPVARREVLIFFLPIDLTLQLAYTIGIHLLRVGEFFSLVLDAVCHRGRVRGVEFFIIDSDYSD